MYSVHSFSTFSGTVLSVQYLAKKGEKYSRNGRPRLKELTRESRNECRSGGGIGNRARLNRRHRPVRWRAREERRRESRRTKGGWAGRSVARLAVWWSSSRKTSFDVRPSRRVPRHQHFASSTVTRASLFLPVWPVLIYHIPSTLRSAPQLYSFRLSGSFTLFFFFSLSVLWYISYTLAHEHVCNTRVCTCVNSGIEANKKTAPHQFSCGLWSFE